MSDLTGANSKIMMTFPFTTSPIELQGFTVDRAVIVDSPDLVTASFDLVGKKYDAMVFNEKTITINFVATSPSIEFFTRWRNMMRIQTSSLNTGVLEINIFNIGKKYIYTQCALKNNKEISDIQSSLGDVEIILNCHPDALVITL